MHPHHQRVIERLVERFQDDSDVLALIIIGSVARGDTRKDSDVDCTVVVTDEAYTEREAGGALSFGANDIAEAEYEGGQAGGGIVNLAFLHEVEQRGPEPARFAFTNALTPLNRLPEIAPLLKRIPVYQEHERREKMIGFASQLPIHLSYAVLADYSQNPYLLAETAVELVLFGGRLILAHNRMLYPGRKWFMDRLERAPKKPASMIDLATELLRRPCIPAAQAFVDAVMGYQDWPQAPEGAMARFQRDRDLLWRNGTTPLADS